MDSLLCAPRLPCRKNERNCAYLEQAPIHVPVLKRAVIDGGMNHVMRERVTHEGSHKRNHYDKYDAQRAKPPARPVHVIARPIIQPATIFPDMFFILFLLFSLFLAAITVIPAKALLLVEGRVKLTLPRVPSIRGLGLLFTHASSPTTLRALSATRARACLTVARATRVM